MENDLQATLFPDALARENTGDDAILHTEGELLTTTIATQSFTLTSRDLDIIYSTGIYKYLSIFQLQRLHFPSANTIALQPTSAIRPACPCELWR